MDCDCWCAVLILVPDGPVNIFCASVSLFFSGGGGGGGVRSRGMCFAVLGDDELCFMLCIRFTAPGHLGKTCAFDSLDIGYESVSFLLL